MSTQTLTSLVGKVLVNLRENADPSLATPYAQLIAEYVNQAKQKVEDAWSWKTLNTTLTFTTVTSQTVYPLTNSATPTVTSTAGAGGVQATGNFPDERASILRDEEGNWQVFDATTASSGGLIRLLRQSRERELALNVYLANQAPVQPNGFSYSVENGTPFFVLIGAPLGGRSMMIRMKVPQPELVNPTDVMLVPWRPVVSWATFLALEERGEEMAERAAIFMDRHNAELQRAIEADEHGEEGYWQIKNLEGGGVGTLTAGFYGPV